nr:TetR/AcrR family transcriptional regulator C-terminal domain-containing protein [Spelaeicoccus albus]
MDRRRVVDAAIDYIDRHGVVDLTMRRLGATLNVEAMALYRHIPGRDQLLDAVVKQVIDDLFDDPRLKDDARSWEEYIYRIANAIREMAISHPKLFPLIATRPPDAPWIRPPLRSMRWIENFLSSLKQHGFSDAAAVTAYKAFTSFILGALLLEAASRGGDLAEIVPMSESSGAERAESYPHVERLQSLLAEDHNEREFEDGLEELIERLRPLLTSENSY